MIVNPVVFGKSGAKTVEVTITHMGTYDCHADVHYIMPDGTYAKYAIEKEGPVTLQMRAGDLFLIYVKGAYVPGLTNATEYARLTQRDPYPYVCQVDA